MRIEYQSGWRNEASLKSWVLLAAWLWLGSVRLLAADEKALAEWTLREPLGHQWRHELIFYPLPVGARADGAYHVLDENGTVWPAQVEKRGAQSVVGFFVDLPANQTRAFRLVRGPAPKAKTDLVVTEEAEAAVVGSGRCAVRIPRRAGFKAGTAFESLRAPILGFRTPAGQWVGQGTLTGKQPVRKFTSEILSRGPVWADARVRYEFDDRKFYQVDLRVLADENVVLVAETFQLSQVEFDQTQFVRGPDLLPDDGSKSQLAAWIRGPKHMGSRAVVTDFDKYPTFNFAFMQGWADRAWDFRGKTFLDRQLYQNPDPRLGMLLCPYQSIGLRTRAVGFCKEDGPDAVGLFYRNLSRWTHRSHNAVPLSWSDAGITGRFVAFEGHREWGIVGTTNQDRFASYGEHGKSKPGLLDAPVVKWGETPLDKVKDWVLEWPEPADAPPFPRLLLTPEKVAELKTAYLNEPALKKLDNPAAQRQAFDHGRGELAHVARTFLRCGSVTPDTMIHRSQEVVRHALMELDFGFTLPTLTPEERRHARACAAFCAYKQADPDYWPCREYGYGPSNPNMMDISINVLACAAGLLRGHPEWKNWGELAAKAERASFLASVSDDGTWFESPGYQGAGNAPANLTLLILKRHGIADLTDMPQPARAGAYFANLLSPPDPRFDNHRMPVALGDNIPFFANYPVWIAGAIKDRYPTEAGNAVWCWEQMGKPTRNDAEILLSTLDTSVKPVPIEGKTKWFPGFGVMFRHGFGTPAETFMTFRWTDHAFGHYDNDVGSFNLYAKGAPLCLDWIDYSPNAADFHNTIAPAGEGFGDTQLAEFATLPGADYARGKQAIRVGSPTVGNWQRQILFVKDEQNPGAATYFVVRDVFDGAETNSCNIWTMAGEPPMFDGDRAARLKGQFGVDAHIAFFRKPPGPLTTMRYDHVGKSYGEWKQTQHRVQAVATSAAEYGFVLYPTKAGQTAPTVTADEAGVVHVKLPDEEHVIFLFPEPTEVQTDQFTFRGRCGVAKKIGGEWKLSLLAGSHFSVKGGKTLEHAPSSN